MSPLTEALPCFTDSGGEFPWSGGESGSGLDCRNSLRGRITNANHSMQQEKKSFREREPNGLRLSGRQQTPLLSAMQRKRFAAATKFRLTLSVWGLPATTEKNSSSLKLAG